MLSGKKMALITDAGTPGISDPAYLLVRECISRGVEVTCLPGATAFVPALINSGLTTNRFCFEGFLPLKKGRQTMLKKLATEERTIILYESPMRLLKTLTHLIEFFGADRPCCVCRELSKKFEENKRGTLLELLTYFSTKPVKGEIVMVIQGTDV
jgi:16S rRNA (cytidine1402-2'-O)-methyltransferase